MTSVAVAETHPAFDWSAEGLSISRKVVSEDLEVIFGRLALLSAGTEGITLPINPIRQVSPVTDLVKTKEIQANNTILQINKHNIDDIRREICAELPHLNEPLPATIQAFDLHRSKKDGNHYLSFLFNEKSGFDLGQERDDVWEVLGDIRGSGKKSLHRRYYEPDIRLARVRSTIPASAVSHIGNYVVKKLKQPLAVTLAPVAESSPTFAMRSQQIAA